MMRILVLLSVPYGAGLIQPREFFPVSDFEIVEKVPSVVTPLGESFPIYKRDYPVVVCEDLLMIIPDRKKNLLSLKNMFQRVKLPLNHDLKKLSYKRKASFNRKMLSR